jgi:hypothetical protein
MSTCSPCPPCDSSFPLLCEPLETTSNAKRLVVEDSAACQKTIQSPVDQQVLKNDSSSNISWTNGTNNTILGKSATGEVEFVTLNSQLQQGPINLGSQPITTTGTISALSLTVTGTVTAGTLTTTSPIVLPSDPTTALQATTKQYVDNADALRVNKGGDTMTGSLTVNNTIESNSTIFVNGNSSKIGYDTGAGGTTTQGAGSKANQVILNRPTGTIVTSNTSLAANTTVTFTLINTVIESTDIVIVSHISGGALGSYNIASEPLAGKVNIIIRNVTAAALAESLTLRFIVLKSVNI